MCSDLEKKHHFHSSQIAINFYNLDQVAMIDALAVEEINHNQTNVAVVSLDASAACDRIE